MASKYDINPMEVKNMNEKELKSYLRNAWKTIGKKVKNFSKSEFKDFSELYNQYQTLSKRWSKPFSGSYKNLKIGDLRKKVKDMITLAHISETKKELEDEGYRNIQNFFKEPRFTKAFINAINENKKLLADIANKNDSFIHDILPSDQIMQLYNQEKTDEEKYKDVLIAVSEELDLRDNEEKEQLLKESFDPVFKSLGHGLFENKETGEVIDIHEKW